jgi:hypothetical protein
MRRSFAEIKEVRLPVRKADQHKPTASDVSCDGMSDRQCEADRDCGINGVSAISQNL